MRGHRAAVYCIAFDRSGRYIITGSDDRLVKVSSSWKFRLLDSCHFANMPPFAAVTLGQNLTVNDLGGHACIVAKGV